MIVNIGKFESTISNAFTKHFKNKGLKIGLTKYFKNYVIINNKKYILNDYKINCNNNIIAILKQS